MKKIVLFIFLFVIFNQAYTQDLLTPLKSKTFGLNHHTNRDVAYFSQIDGNGNSIIVATTEKDSTFTDVLTTKLDVNYNLIWQKRLSIDTNLSYDIPLKSFINSDNELYIIGRSSFNQSNSNGLIFIIKYSENGDVMYKKTIGNIDGSDYDDYGYMDVMLNSDGSLSLVYNPYANQTFKGKVFNFIKIDNQGNIVSSFTKEIEYQDIIGIIDLGNFYFLTKEELNGGNNTYTYKFYRILDENNQSSFELTDSKFIDYYKNTAIFDQVKLTIDANKNCYLTCQNIHDNDKKEKINLSKIDNNNTLVYSITTSDNDNYFLIDTFINSQNNNITVANNINNNSIDFINVDQNNTIQTITNPSKVLATGFKKNNDESFFITTSNSNIILFSNELIELKSFNTSDTYELIDFSKNDENNITTIGIKYDKMFPESDYTTQLDIKVEKISDSKIVNNYSYSGIGTSRAFQQRVIIDNDNNYLVLVTEKMGPEYLGIGGESPPLNKRIIKYNSNLEVLWEVEIPSSILNIVNHGGSDIRYYLDTNNDLYLNLPKARDKYFADYDLCKISSTGKFEFITNSVAASSIVVHENSIYIASVQFLNTTTGLDQFKMFKLEKSTGKLLEETNIETERFLTFYLKGSDIFYYTYLSTSNGLNEKIFLYKNNEKNFGRIIAYNNGVYPMKIDTDGALLFATNYSGRQNTMNKLEITNLYSYYNTSNDNILAISKYSNGNIFLYLENNNTIILDKSLHFISYGDNFYSWNPYVMSWDNYLLLGNGGNKMIRVIDENGKVISKFYTQGSLHRWNSKIDKQHNLIMTGQFGNRIHTFNHYGWYRGFIHSYKILDNILSNEIIDSNNQERDFIIYPNPTSDILNIKMHNRDIKKIIIYDISGKQLKEFYSNVINLEDLKSGIYLMKIYTTSNSVINSKVIRN